MKHRLTEQELDAVLSGGTGFQNGKQRVSQYFSEDYSNDDIEGIIIQLLEEWNATKGVVKQ